MPSISSNIKPVFYFFQETQNIINQIKNIINNPAETTATNKILNNKFLYIGWQGAENWCALEEADKNTYQSPEILSNSIKSIYDKHLKKENYALISLGCGSGDEDVSILGELKTKSKPKFYYTIDLSADLLVTGTKNIFDFITKKENLSDYKNIESLIGICDDITNIDFEQYNEKALIVNDKIKKFFHLLGFTFSNNNELEILTKIVSLMDPNDLLLLQLEFFSEKKPDESFKKIEERYFTHITQLGKFLSSPFSFDLKEITDSDPSDKEKSIGYSKTTLRYLGKTINIYITSSEYIEDFLNELQALEGIDVIQLKNVFNSSVKSELEEAKSLISFYVIENDPNIAICGGYTHKYVWSRFCDFMDRQLINLDKESLYLNIIDVFDKKFQIGYGKKLNKDSDIDGISFVLLQKVESGEKQMMLTEKEKKIEKYLNDSKQIINSLGLDFESEKSDLIQYCIESYKGNSTKTKMFDEVLDASGDSSNVKQFLEKYEKFKNS
jgi:hypothetical protein